MWKDFFENLNRLRESGQPFVLATVVKVSGSTYRRPGARALITRDGATTGLISGGCFESDLIERAKRVIATGEPVTLTFDTTSPDDLLFGLGLGCTGVAQILMQPFQGNANQEHLDFIATCQSRRENGVLATIFRVDGESRISKGNYVIARRDHPPTSNIHDHEIVDAIFKEAVIALDSRKSHSFQILNGAAEALVEFIGLPVPLLIFGAGPDAVPLVRFARQLGWNVTVVDRRPALARPDRFPDADAVILSEPEDLAKHLSFDAENAAVIMTHHFETDANFLKQVLASRTSYIGLLGPAAKAELLLQKLRDDGFPLTGEQLSRIYSPVGLDLGAETPEEIALAIIAEIQAARTGYPAGFLKSKTGPIHQRD